MRYLILLLLISCDNTIRFSFGEKVKLSKNHFYGKLCPNGIVREKLHNDLYYVDIYEVGNVEACPIDYQRIYVQDLVKIKENNGNDK